MKEKETLLGGKLKQALEDLHLETKGKMTSSKCKEYTSHFQRIASQIPNLSSEEALRIILRQIPHYLAQKLRVECSKRRNVLKYKICGLSDVDLSQVQTFLNEQLSVSPKWVDKSGNDFIAEIKSPENVSEKRLWTRMPFKVMVCSKFPP